MNKALMKIYMGLYTRRNDNIATQDEYFLFLDRIGALGGCLLSDAEVEKRFYMVINNPYLTIEEKYAGLDLLSVFVINRTTARSAHPLLDMISIKQQEYLFPEKTSTVRPWDVYVQECQRTGENPSDEVYLQIFGLPLEELPKELRDV